MVRKITEYPYLLQVHTAESQQIVQNICANQQNGEYAVHTM